MKAQRVSCQARPLSSLVVRVWKKPYLLATNYDRIRDHIEHVIPSFEDFNDRIRTNVFYCPTTPAIARRPIFPKPTSSFPLTARADRSNNPTSKSLMISIKPSPDAAAAVDDLLRDAKARL